MNPFKRARRIKVDTGEAMTENTMEEKELVEAHESGEPGAVDGAAANADPPSEAGGAEVAALQAELAEWRDRAMRARADLENFRRRTQHEMETLRKFASEGLITELLPPLENFERALAAAEASQDFEGLKNGVELIHRQLTEVLQRAGLERIEAVGAAFDPNLHEAIMQVEPEEGQEPHLVVEELRAGYRLRERVLRPTLVKVTSG